MNPLRLLQRYILISCNCFLFFLFFSFKGSAQGTFTDQSGNTYKTVRIGNKIWMAENLRTTRFSNGEKINFITKPGNYLSEIDPDDNGYTKLTNGQYLYSWPAVQDVRGIAPKGWHVATPEDWKYLIANCKTSKDIRSVTGWQSIKSGGYHQTLTCPNCINWNAEYRSKVACHTCQDNRLVKGKYIPVTYTSMNGNDRFQFNAKQLGNINEGRYSTSYELFWSSTLDTRPENCGSRCGQAYIFNLSWFKVDSEKYSSYMLPIRLVKDNNDFYDVGSSPKTSEVYLEQPKSSTKPLLKTVEVPAQPEVSYTPPLSSAITLGQTAKDKQVIILGGLGQAGNRFSNLDAFVKKITDTINKELQGETPYVIRRVKNGAATGIVSAHSKSGEEKSITINLIPSTEQKRYYFFTCSAAIYSETTDFNYLLSELRVNAAKKSRLFTSETVYYLGFDFINLADFNNLNPQQPNKKYKLLLIYFAGTKPQAMTPSQGSGATPKE